MVQAERVRLYSGEDLFNSSFCNPLVIDVKPFTMRCIGINEGSMDASLEFSTGLSRTSTDIRQPKFDRGYRNGAFDLSNTDQRVLEIYV